MAWISRRTSSARRFSQVRPISASERISRWRLGVLDAEFGKVWPSTTALQGLLVVVAEEISGVDVPKVDVVGLERVVWAYRSMIRFSLRQVIGCQSSCRNREVEGLFSARIFIISKRFVKPSLVGEVLLLVSKRFDVYK